MRGSFLAVSRNGSYLSLGKDMCINAFITLPNASGLTAKTNGNQVELTWAAATKPEYLTDDYFRKNYKKF